MHLCWALWFLALYACLVTSHALGAFYNLDMCHVAERRQCELPLLSSWGLLKLHHQGGWWTLSAGLLVAQCTNPRKTIWQRLTAEGPYPCYRPKTIIRKNIRGLKHILKVKNGAFPFFAKCMFWKNGVSGEIVCSPRLFSSFSSMLKGFHVFPHGVSCFPFPPLLG